MGLTAVASNIVYENLTMDTQKNDDRKQHVGVEVFFVCLFVCFYDSCFTHQTKWKIQVCNYIETLDYVDIFMFIIPVYVL